MTENSGLNDSSLGQEDTISSASADRDHSIGSLPTLRSPVRRFKDGEKILNRYCITGELGQGGMGIVYRCHDEVGGIDVALKALPPELSHNSVEMEEVRENFQLVQKLHHPNIAAIKTLEKDPATGDYYLIMECVEGINLRRWAKVQRSEIKDQHSPLATRNPPFAIDDILPIVRQVAAALDYAHSQGIIHRDIKPSNIMVGGEALDFRLEAEPPKAQSLKPMAFVKVLDFGLAAQIHTSLSRVSQVQHGTSGTGPYMAPEQWRGQYQDAATDQYALAVMIYEMLSGHPPFESHDPMVLRGAVLNEAIPKLGSISFNQWKTLEQALSKDRKARFGSCGEFVGELAGGMGQGAWSKRRKTRTTRKGKSPQKGTKKILVGVCIVAGLLGVGCYFGYRAYEADRAVKAEAVRVAQEKERSLAIKQKTISVLMETAQSAFNRGDLDVASGKVGEVLAAEALHAGALALRAEIEQKADERKVREAKAKADVAFEDFSKAAEAHGGYFDKGSTALRQTIRTAEEAYKAQVWGEAFTAYQSAAEASGKLIQIARQRASALEQQQLMKGSKETAERLDAPRLALTQWTQAMTAETGAREKLTGDKFAEAAQEFNSAMALYVQAGTVVKTVQDSLAAQKKPAAVAPVSQAETPVAAEPIKKYTLPLDHETSIDFVWVPPGAFMMGSPSSEIGRDNDERQATVRVEQGFWMSATEITIGQYIAWLKADKTAVDGMNSARKVDFPVIATNGTFQISGSAYGKNMSQPMVYVKYIEATRFSQWLTGKARAAGMPETNCRLPTETEWEYACRAGTSTPFAGTLQNMAWYGANSMGTTHPVGMKQPNGWGLYDMHGNVWEWCFDNTGTQTKPIRGGSWSDLDFYCRSANKASFHQADSDNILGFRIILARQ